jgi:hypothetical protein
MCMHEHLVWVIAARGLIVSANNEHRRGLGRCQTQDMGKMEVDSKMHEEQMANGARVE